MPFPLPYSLCDWFLLIVEAQLKCHPRREPPHHHLV